MRQPPSELLPPLDLPEELILEILLRLPVNSLLRFKCVCKSWKTLISSPQFVKNHLHNSISDTSMIHQRLVSLTKDEPREMVSCSVQSLFENPSAPPKTLSFKVEPQYQLIVGSCNGLMCLCDKDGYFRLWNPSTRLASERSPRVAHPIAHYGFGYDKVNNKYKVLIVTRDFPNPKETKIYTFGTNSWTTIQNPLCDFHWRDMLGKFVSGTLNWLAREGDVVISFDLEKETYGVVSLPLQMEGHSLVVSNNCLCVCCFSDKVHYVMWQMKEYGVEESWTKLTWFPHEKFVSPFFSPLSHFGIVLGKYTDSQIVLYNPKTTTYHYPKIERRFRDGTIHIYHESLVSP